MVQHGTTMLDKQVSQKLPIARWYGMFVVMNGNKQRQRQQHDISITTNMTIKKTTNMEGES
jgi:hypothetical protein